MQTFAPLALVLFWLTVSSCQASNHSCPHQGTALLQYNKKVKDASIRVLIDTSEEHGELVPSEQPRLRVRAFAEFIAMTLFVIIGCGSAMGIANKDGYAWVLQVSFSFGLAITVLACAVGHISGAHINCAVTFALALEAKITPFDAGIYFAAQMLGSLAGAGILCLMYPPTKDLTGGLGSNGVSDGWSKVNALVGEIMMTFLLVFVVLNAQTLAPLAIGFAVFLAHSVLIPIDGCSINPTRSFGPAVLASIRSKGGSVFTDMWIFWVGPLTGAALAALLHLHCLA